MKILVVHTGGTIGMVKTDSGFAPRDGIVEAAIADIVSQGKINAHVDIKTLLPLIDSAQATPDDWQRINQTIFDAKDAYDAFVVTHGTDTLAFSASALCLGLPGFEKPVVITGAMLPLTVESSDGQRNLEDSLHKAAELECGVWVQFAGKTLHGGLVRKSHSSALDAFEAPPSPTAPFVVSDTPALSHIKTQKIGVFSVTPAPFAEALEFQAENCDGILLRCYGSGTAPNTDTFTAALDKARQNKVPIIAVSQCPEGGMRLGTYAAGKVLREGGVIDGRDMTPEMACVKLHSALTLFDTYEEQKEYLSKCLCGEMTL